MDPNSNTSEKSTFIEDRENKEGSSRKLTPAEYRLRWRNLAVVMIILNVLLLVIVLTVVIVWQNDRNERQLVPHPEKLCLPCGDISLHKDDDIWNLVEFQTSTDESGQQVCCANTQEELHNLVKLVSKSGMQC